MIRSQCVPRIFHSEFDWSVLCNVAPLVLSEHMQCAVYGIFQALACDVAPRAGRDFGCLSALFWGHTAIALGPVCLIASLVPPNSCSVLCFASLVPFNSYLALCSVCRSYVLHCCQVLFLTVTCYIFDWCMPKTCPPIFSEDRLCIYSSDL